MRLAPIAAALTVIIIISFGVCMANFNLEGDSPPIAQFAVGVEIVAIAGLVVLGVIRISRS